MGVDRIRSTKIAPEALSTSYLTGSASLGISMTTLISCGGLLPVGTRSRPMGEGAPRCCGGGRIFYALRCSKRRRRLWARRFRASRLPPLLQQRHQEQGHDVDDLDQRVVGRAGSVLVGIADGVAGDRGLVRLGTLAAEVAVLDVLLATLPR